MISKAQAIIVAGNWHGGMNTMLYRLASTGYVPARGSDEMGALVMEIRRCMVESTTPTDDLEALLGFLKRNA